MASDDDKAFSDARAMTRGLGGTDLAKSYTLALTTTAASSVALAAGLYRIWIPGGLPSEVVVAVAGDTSTAVVPTPDANGVIASSFAGDEREFFRATAAHPYLWAKTITASATLRMSRIGE